LPASSPPADLRQRSRLSILSVNGDADLYPITTFSVVRSDRFS